MDRQQDDKKEEQQLTAALPSVGAAKSNAQVTIPTLSILTEDRTSSRQPPERQEEKPFLDLNKSPKVEKSVFEL
ncbi:MAG: hypothetical protein ACRCZB_06805 [Bacteroidales bacterium]